MRSHQGWSCFLTLFTPLWIIHHFSVAPIDPEESGQVPRNLWARPTHFVRGSGYYNLERLAWANVLLPAEASPWKCSLRVLLGPVIGTCCSERLARPHHQVQGCQAVITTALPHLMELLLSRITHILLSFSYPGFHSLQSAQWFDSDPSFLRSWRGGVGVRAHVVLLWWRGHWKTRLSR